MSTRGSVAWIEDGGACRGVYIGNCSQPTAAGREILARTGVLGLQGLTGELRSRSEAERLFDPFDDALSMEWVYLVRPEAGTIEVWAHALYSRARSLNGKRWSGKTYVARCSGNVYTHVHVLDIRVSEPEPDWERLEERVRAMALTN